MLPLILCSPPIFFTEFIVICFAHAPAQNIFMFLMARIRVKIVSFIEVMTRRGMNTVSLMKVMKRRGMKIVSLSS